MDQMSLEQVDRELGSWLREERATRAPERLVEDVFARTSRTRQARQWPLARRPSFGEERPRTTSRFFPGLVGAAAVVLIVAIALTNPLGLAPGPGQVPTPTPTPVSTESPGASPPSPSPGPTPEPTTLDTFSAQSLFLGTDAAPIGVTGAFDTIWVANIHANQVRRYDPDTMAEVARIPAQSAAWFAATDDGMWVTHQTDVGLSRIDPATNTVVANVGDVPPCAEPVLAHDSLWQSACDAGVILRIDPTTNELTDRIPSEGHLWLAVAGDELYGLASDGLGILDPEDGTFTPLPNPDAAGGDFVASDGNTLWVLKPTGIVRIDPATGETLARLDNPAVRAITFANSSAWVTTAGGGVIEVGMATNEALRTIPVPGDALVSYVTGDTLWVTDFNNSLLWRVDL
jgi:streptogramin lyase